jgi:hypothetical protein
MDIGSTAAPTPSLKKQKNKTQKSDKYKVR